MKQRTRNRQINFRVTNDEYISIKKNAAQANMSLQAYLLHAALKKQKIIVLQSTEDLKKIRGDIKKIGNNINQIVKLAHTYGFLPHYLSDIRDRQVILLQIINKLYFSFQKK